MANFMPNPNSDYIFNSAALRNLPPEFVGNAHWDYTLQNDRLKSFLSRNLLRARSDHQNRVQQDQSPIRSDQPQMDVVQSNQGLNDIAPILNAQTLPNSSNKPVQSLGDVFSGHDTSVPAPEAMSVRTVFRKRRKDAYDTQRQSLRRTQKLHEDPESFLILEVNNIRKKLNWKETKAARKAPLKKRPRHDSVDCVISLAVWDNSGPTTSKLPLVIKRESCQSTKIKRESDQTNGEFVELSLEEPFIISQKELRVATNSFSNRRALAKQYFLEIKITPKDQKISWPPIPMLGKSDGERFNGMGTDAKDESNTSMIARYQHLPAAPEVDTPMSIFVFAEGRTFRTKYGLEVSAKWVSKDDPAVARKPTSAPELEPWAFDDGNPFGRPDPERKASKMVPQAARKTATRKSTPKPPKLPNITYNILVPKGTKSDFNQFSVRGLKCYACAGKTFESLVELRFHLDQHHKNRSTVENEVVDPKDSRLVSATIFIEATSNYRLRAVQDEHDDEANKLFSYVAPNVPFDLQAHYAGKKTPWTEVLPAQTLKEAAKIPTVLPVSKDSQSILRREHKGHVPYQKVLPFRPQGYQRKKYPVKKLLTQHVSLENPYTSMSHRPIRFDDNEDARSETDDEIDDSWFVDRHVEELDLYAWQEGWSDPRRRLAKKWDWHMLHRERGVSARYMGDCLIRFIRMEKRWLMHEELKNDPIAYFEAQTQSLAALTEMMDELKNMRVINENVCTDVLTMLYDEEDLKIPTEEQTEMATQAEEILARRDKIRLHQKSTKRHSFSGTLADVCVECRLKIHHGNKRAVRCCDLRCSTPNAWYHAKCAGLSIGDTSATGAETSQAVVTQHFMKTRQIWKCKSCTKGKEKETMAAVMPNATQIEATYRQSIAEGQDPARETPRIIAGNAMTSSRSPSVVPSTLLQMVQKITPQDVFEVVDSRKPVFTRWVNDRSPLRGIVAHHFGTNPTLWNTSNCIYAIIDERRRAKKFHTVLAICQLYERKPVEEIQVFIKFPDDITKRDSEHWWLNNRDFEAEVLQRFKPYKVQHYAEAPGCIDHPRTAPKCDHKILSLDQEEQKSRGHEDYVRLEKQPERGFYLNEQNDPRGIWNGGYFEEIQRQSQLESQVVCPRIFHKHCAHSVTAAEGRYRAHAKVEFVPWSEL